MEITPHAESLSPHPSELEQTQSDESPNYDCSPGRRLSMPSEQFSSSDDSDEEAEDASHADRRMINLWTPISDEKKKREILANQHINYRRMYRVKRQDGQGSVLKCALHDDCAFLVRILFCGGCDVVFFLHFM